MFPGTFAVQLIGEETHHASPKPQLNHDKNFFTHFVISSIVLSRFPSPTLIFVVLPEEFTVNTSVVFVAALSGIQSALPSAFQVAKSDAD